MIGEIEPYSVEPLKNGNLVPFSCPFANRIRFIQLYIWSNQTPRHQQRENTVTRVKWWTLRLATAVKERCTHLENCYYRNSPALSPVGNKKHGAGRPVHRFCDKGPSLRTRSRRRWD